MSSVQREQAVFLLQTLRTPPALRETGQLEVPRPRGRPEPDIREGKEATCRGFPVLGSTRVFFLPAASWTQNIPLGQDFSVPSLQEREMLLRTTDIMDHEDNLRLRLDVWFSVARSPARASQRLECQE